MADAPAFGIGLFFLVAIILIIIAIFCYIIFWRPPQPATSCTTNKNCANGQICSSNRCIEIICQSDGDCGNGSCVNSFCIYPNCLEGESCGINQACINQTCTIINNTCSNDSDCRGTQCIDGRCQQCTSNVDCKNGMGCFNGACIYPTSQTPTPDGSIIIPVSAPGNFRAPYAFLCPSTSCANNGVTPALVPCSETSPCPGGCTFCASGFCRCTPGLLYESCVNNNDCESGVCSNDLKICIGSGGECAYNFDSTDPNNPNRCTSKTPYCVDGTCNASSLGAPCANGPSDLCRNPSALGSTLKAADQNAGFNCVNGFCQQEAGLLNQQCTSGSCIVYNNNNLICTNTTGELRCQIAQ